MTDAKTKVFRTYSRQLSNSLASQAANEPTSSDGGWNTNIVIQRRLYHKIGPMLPELTEVPKYYQIYVLDSASDSLEKKDTFRIDLKTKVF